MVSKRKSFFLVRCGGFIFERRAFNVVHEFFIVFKFDVARNWQYDPLNTIGTCLYIMGTLQANVNMRACH